MNTNTVVIGLVLIVIGIFTLWFCFGIIFLIAGFVIMIIGLVQSEKPETVVQQYYGMPPPGPYQQQGQQYAPAYTGQVMYCQYCGNQLFPGAEYCPRCGRHTKK